MSSFGEMTLEELEGHILKECCHRKPGSLLRQGPVVRQQTPRPTTPTVEPEDKSRVDMKYTEEDREMEDLIVREATLKDNSENKGTKGREWVNQCSAPQVMLGEQKPKAKVKAPEYDDAEEMLIASIERDYSDVK